MMSDVDTQRAYIRTHHVGFDEITLLYDDVLSEATGKHPQGLLTKPEYQIIESVNSSVETLSSQPADAWNSDSFIPSLEWPSMRQAAHTAYQQLAALWPHTL